MRAHKCPRNLNFFRKLIFEMIFTNVFNSQNSLEKFITFIYLTFGRRIAARLDQQNFPFRVFGEAICQNTTSRACTDDYEIVIFKTY